MTKFPDLFKGLKLNKYYKVLLYIFGIILILSIFFEVKNVDVVFVRTLSLWMIFGSIAAWILEELFYYLVALADSYCLRRDAEAIGFILVILTYGIQAYIWIYIMQHVLNLF